MSSKINNATLYLMSFSAGLVVANLYYNQPLLDQIARSFHVSEAEVSHVALSTQLGYALGLLFIIPLGDKVSNKKILDIDFLVMIIALFITAFSPSLSTLIISSFLVGFTSSIPQLFVPMAAHLAHAENRGRAIGIVMSGLLIGILGSRTLSGLIGEQFGWRRVYVIAAIAMMVLYWILRWKLPRIDPAYKGTYKALMRSIAGYVKEDATIRLAALRGALAFAGLSAFWTTLVFLMKDSFGYGSGVTGAFGLVGIVGAVAASLVGKWNDRIGRRPILITSGILLLLSWGILWESEHSILGLILGVILIDLGMQALHITNQNIIFSKYPEARNRINTIYMVSFFIGGAIGTSIGAVSYELAGWHGVSMLGIGLTLVLLVIIFSKRTVEWSGEQIK
ncbi:MFS transporter [Sinomicrobium weinanense]|uniref:MFS transporter n=1 Tax=Sinomicrobium weinanense TaxID=2842200 RepID=A0A926JS85_9FLAO|nr:MFS transporter [Sinomicrobium weinanense]MBC9796266.1 MFS transporter [Sinomicrobium weinanense]MBU3122279.1 MFS transporter [Sinomicrobium weinanense]